jgi:hypothetical protein
VKQSRRLGSGAAYLALGVVGGYLAQVSFVPDGPLQVHKGTKTRVRAALGLACALGCLLPARGKRGGIKIDKREV